MEVSITQHDHNNMIIITQFNMKLYEDILDTLENLTEDDVRWLRMQLSDFRFYHNHMEIF